MNTLVEITAETSEELERRIGAFQTLCTSVGFQVRRADYRHKEGFLSTLPLLAVDPDLERKSRRNVLTRDAAAAFPFSSYEICDQSGIMLGINLHNRSVCMLDIFDSSKYESANMSIIGMTGAGKSFLLQLIAMRLRQQGVRVIMIVPEKGYEFRPACEAAGGVFIKLAPSSPDCINWMEIRKRSLDANARIKNLAVRDDSLLADQIEFLHLQFTLRMPDMSNEDRELLDSVFVECYRRYGITFDNASLFEQDGVTFRPQPDYYALYGLFMEKPETKKFAPVISRYVTGSASRMGGQTNVDLDNPYIVIDISEAGKDSVNDLMFRCFHLCKEICYQDITLKKALIMDELWRLIGSGSNKLVAEYVLEFFKVVRGLGGAAIGSTQDLNDYKALEDGKYGKGILNASRFKIVLPLEEDEAMAVKDMLKLSDEETLQILRSRRGEGLLCAGHNRISVSFRATEREYQWITTQRSDLVEQLRGNQN